MIPLRGLCRTLARVVLLGALAASLPARAAPDGAKPDAPRANGSPQSEAKPETGKRSRGKLLLPAAPSAAPAAPSAGEAEGAGASRYGIIPPAEKIDDLKTHWERRLTYLRDRDERRADDEEQNIRQLRDELGLDNLFAISSALVRESDEAAAAGSAALARKRCELAISLAPDLPASYLCLGRALMAEDLTQVKPAVAALSAAIKAAARDDRTARATTANIGAVILFGLLLAGAAFALLLFFRYAKLYFHDVHHFFPRGARRWQTAILGLAMVLSPLLLQLGPVPLLFTLLAAAAIYATTIEVVIGGLVILSYGAAPFAVEALARNAAYAGPAADLWMIERGEGTAAGIARLNQRLEQPNAEFAVAFALARRAKRENDLATAERLYKRALVANGLSSQTLAATHNNLGNVELLMGDADAARSQYAQAIEMKEGLAPAHFNLSRALALGGVEQLERVQSEQARALDLNRAEIEAFTGGTLQANRKANKFVMDMPLPQETLEPMRDAEAARAEPVGDEARARLIGPATMEMALIPPLAAIAILALIVALRGRVKPSGRCERCGREVCKRCDADARPAEALCAQCVNVYIRRNSVEPAERIRKEKAVEQYRRRRSLMLRAMSFLSGAAHVLMGHPLVGMLFLVLTSLLASSVLLWGGVIHLPNAVRAGLSIARVGVTVALFFIVYGLCLRDFLARQRVEG